MVCLLSGFLFVLLTSVASAQKRIALVIGNSSYTYAKPLSNARNDARDISEMLKSVGFDVYEGYDLDRRETLELAARMSRQLKPDDIALAYYAGHGVQIGTQNYLMPVDAFGQTSEQLKETSVSLRAILSEIELRAEINIVLLDACRNNPFETELAARSGGSAARGLARVDASIGSFIAFATQPGNVALDGDGRNSPFATALLKHLPDSNEDLHEVMRRVRKDVIDETDSFQVPWENSSLIDKVYLAGGPFLAPAEISMPTEIVPKPTIAPAPVPEPVPTPERAVHTHIVRGLDPNGDGFLALRAGTSSGAQRLAAMPEGTRLKYLGQLGVWMNVVTDTGLEGWAHTGWIAPLTSEAAVPASGTAAVTCDRLWHQRNAIFARRGYCFQSARGQSTFGNTGCLQGVPAAQIPLTSLERGEVSSLLEREQAMGCR